MKNKVRFSGTASHTDTGKGAAKPWPSLGQRVGFVTCSPLPLSASSVQPGALLSIPPVLPPTPSLQSPVPSHAPSSLILPGPCKRCLFHDSVPEPPRQGWGRGGARQGTAWTLAVPRITCLGEPRTMLVFANYQHWSGGPTLPIYRTSSGVVGRLHSDDLNPHSW